MLKNNMKNIVILKNLPSNLVEEAIVILKSNKTAKRLQFIEKNSKISYNRQKIENDYIIKEAESVISSYIKRLEKNKILRKSSKNIESKYKRIKAYSIIVSIMLTFGIVKTFIEHILN